MEERSKSLQSTLELQTSIISDFNAKILEILKQNQELSEECQRMKEEAAEFLPKIEAASIMSKQICELKEENEKLLKSEQDKENRIKELELQLSEKKSDFSEIKISLQKKLNITSTSQEATLEEIQTMIQKLGASKSGNNKELEEKIEDLEDKLNTSELALITLKEQFDQQAEELDNSTIMVQNLQKERSLLKQSQVILQSQVRENQNKAEKNRKEAAEVINDLKAKIAKNDEFREMILQRLKELNIENKELKDKLNIKK